MNRLSFIVSCMFFIAISSLDAFPQLSQRKYIRHIDGVHERVASFSNIPIAEKSNRVSNSKGNIILIYDETLPDSIKIALDVAKDLWESKLPTKQPVYIQTDFQSCGEDISMITDILLTEEPKGCPTALCSQLSDIAYGSPESPRWFYNYQY